MGCLASAITRSQIIERTAGEDRDVTDRAVDVQIVGLRRKLGDAGGMIETVRGIGAEGNIRPDDGDRLRREKDAEGAFSLPEDVADVKLSIYNALGEKVAELVNTALTAGKYQYQWNAQDVATGMYLYELRTMNFVSVKKMLLVR